jgi:phospholipid/cholesterol/gamma-HCH transport system substrate-binding protein
MFSNTFKLKTEFKTVSGLKVGNNVRFSGINIGTVSEIEILTDTSVLVYVIIKKELQKC